jgi:parallel beta-helix repeat protein
MKKSSFFLVRLLIIVMFLFSVSPTPTVATTRCVNPGGTGGCYDSIQKAIDDSSAGDTINVAAGTYVEDITLKAGVKVIGAGASSSIIQGTGGTPSTRAPVVKANEGNITSDTLLQGFTITGGNANANMVDSFGGGVFIDEGAAPTIRDNLITGNRATIGGGIFIRGNSTPVIEGNTITANNCANGGGIYIKESSPTVSNNHITNNNATEGAATGAGQGGGIVIIRNASPVVTSNIISGNVSSCDSGGVLIQENSAPTISGNTVQGNRTTGSVPCGIGGGVKFFDGGSGIFEHNIVKDNISSAGGGGILVEKNSTPTINCNKILNNQAGLYGGGINILSGSLPTITNNYIARNRAQERGGGIVINSATPTIRNNTIVANNATGIGEGIYIIPASAAPTIVNNIIINNNYGIQRAAGPFLGTADYNDVWNNVIKDYSYIDPGPHDISADPWFVDAASDNYQLSLGSPAVDAGLNAGAPSTDIDGVTRPQDGDADGDAIVDMGAHELMPSDAQLRVSPNQAVFTYDPNDPVGSPSSVFMGTITIQNIGVSKNIIYTVTPPSSPPFPVSTLDPLSGSLTPSGSTDFRYNIDVSGLITGTYDATFTISAIQDGGESVPGSPATHQVRAMIGSLKKVYLPMITKNR